MIIKNLGLQNYQVVLKNMQNLTQTRDERTTDELWIVRFNSIFTTGIKKNNLSGVVSNKINNIPVVKTDRGGDITYHSKGQVVIYLLLDLIKLKVGVKKLVSLIEDSIIQVLKNYNISAHKRDNMPGVYVNNKKIASLGLRVKNNKTYHGLSLNVGMDLTPFSYIDVCGYKNLEVCQMSDFIANIDINEIENELSQIIKQNLCKN